MIGFIFAVYLLILAVLLFDTAVRDNELKINKKALASAKRGLFNIMQAPGCGCHPICRCNNAESLKCELDARMDEARECLREVIGIQLGEASNESSTR